MKKENKAYTIGLKSVGKDVIIWELCKLTCPESISIGNSVILDATYGKAHHRDEALRMARDLDANIIFVECVLKEALLKERLSNRKTKFSISDARMHHFEYFRERFEALNEVGKAMHIRVNTEKPLEECMQKILAKDYIEAFAS